MVVIGKFSKIIVLIFLLGKLLVLGGCAQQTPLTPTPSIQFSAGNGAVDIDGNTYTSVVYGNGQEWLGENLRTTHFANGDQITEVTSSGQWFTSGRLQSSYNGDSQFDIPYGKYYNWYAIIDDRNVCPDGWHVPIMDEWESFLDYIGGAEDCGPHLRLTGTQFWSAPNNNATNASGFSAVGAGYRHDINGGGFGYLGHQANWWSTGAEELWLTGPFNDGNYGLSLWTDKDIDFCSIESRRIGSPQALSVRCLRGQGPVPLFDSIQNFDSTNGSIMGDVINNRVAPHLQIDAGLCWSTSPNPTIDNSPSGAGMIIGASLNSDIYSVYGEIYPAPTSGVTYYVRLYAKNTFGIGYGIEEVFTAP